MEIIIEIYFCICYNNFGGIKMRVLISLIILISLFSFVYSSEEKLVFATCEWPPFEYTENGKQKGTDVEVIKKVFSKIGIPIEVRFLPWNRAILLAKKNEIDGIFTLRINDEREKFLVYPKEHISISQNVFFYKFDSYFEYTGMESLYGKKITMTQGYSYGDEFMTSAKIIRETAPNDSLNFKKLLKERADLFICDKLVGVYLLDKMNLKDKIKYTESSLSEFKMYLAFTNKKDYTDIMNRFDTALKELKESGEYAKIFNAYFQ